MKKEKISSGYLESLWCSIGEGQSLNGVPQGLNFNNHNSVKILAEKILRPYIEEHNEKWQRRVKGSMRFAIACYSPTKLMDLYYAALPQLEPPPENLIRDFYLDVYKNLFFEDPLVGFDIANYEEMPHHFHEIY